MIITEEDVRVLMSDKPELNPLLNDVRFSSEQIQHAIDLVIAAANNENPPAKVEYTPDSFFNKFVLLNGVTGWLLRTAAINEASNQFDYQADGVSIQDKNKAALFSQLSNEYWTYFTDSVKADKIRININNAYGGVSSPYKNFRRF